MLQIYEILTIGDYSTKIFMLLFQTTKQNDTKKMLLSFTDYLSKTTKLRYIAATKINFHILLRDLTSQTRHMYHATYGNFYMF